MFVLSAIRTDKTAVVYGTNPDPLSRDSSFSSPLQAAIRTVGILRKDPGRISLVEAKRFALALAHASQQEPGVEHTQEETGLTFRIDPAERPPNVCPCCGALVRPGDHASAGQEDALCLGCFTWDDGPQCLPANSAHPVPWVEDGELFEGAGDFGGNIQCGKAYNRRFHHATLPGRVVNIVAYPVMGDGTTRDLPEGEIWLEWQTETMVCRDVDDPGGTKVWSDVEYSDLPERFDFTWPTVGAAEAAARNLVTWFDPAHIGWDGRPDESLARHAHTLREFSGELTDAPPSEAARSMIAHNQENRTDLDWDAQEIVTKDGEKLVVAWVFDTQDMVNTTPDDPWSGPPAGGEAVVCWWAPAPPDCDTCNNYGEVAIFHASTDGLIGHRPCPACTPADTAEDPDKESS